MKVVKKNFSEKIKNDIEAARQEIRSQHDLPVRSNNIYLICEKIYALRSILEIYVECGVFKGSTVFTAATFARNLGIKRTFYGFDSFAGFPHHLIDEKDQPGFFNYLLENNLITEEHYKKAAIRTTNFTNKDHLTRQYFSGIERVFEIATNFKNVKLFRGNFENTLKVFNQDIAILFLDCDLYQSYKFCLDSLYQKIIPGGVVIFDEYYSFKFPGPRLAVNDFFKDKKGYFELYIADEGFERWCFIKQE